jgi:hypothetical protein
MKSTWKIIYAEKGESNYCTDIQSIKIDNNVIMNQNTIAKAFNNYFLSTADSINTDNNKHLNMGKAINYLSHNLTKSLTKSNWHYGTTYEREKNHKILKVKKYTWV